MLRRLPLSPVLVALAGQGEDYDGAQRSFVERASCVIYRTIAKDGSLACRD